MESVWARRTVTSPEPEPQAASPMSVCTGQAEQLRPRASNCPETGNRAEWLSWDVPYPGKCCCPASLEVCAETLLFLGSEVIVVLNSLLFRAQTTEHVAIQGVPGPAVPDLKIRDPSERLPTNPGSRWLPRTWCLSIRSTSSMVPHPQG